ncbi:hypothetical protein Micbo1qcDRAFT_233709 [Microdochium bolleyi]|uniref:Mucin n=1 Tax=Microdochium bolleyi TaxID=196109 RepID=A0A136J5I4_9PEZI|nr:hypothetical protein Micbo1qcDRAFT_233709 [Microdochium bolleyi]
MPHVTGANEASSCPSPLDAHDRDSGDWSSSVAYHETLTEQNKQLRPVASHNDEAPSDDHSRRGQTLRNWIPFGGKTLAVVAPGSTPVDGPSGQAPRDIKSSGEVRVKPICAPTSRETAMATGHEPTPSTMSFGPHTSPTRKDVEEYEALPLAIQRKFFSSAERLRLAQSSTRFLALEDHRATPRPAGTSARLLTTTDTRSWAAAIDSNNLASRVAVLDIPRGSSEARPVTSPLPAKADFQVQSDFLALANLPAKIREKHLTREEQLLLARQLRQSVLLDAADEALYRIGQRRNHENARATDSSEASAMATVHVATLMRLPSDKIEAPKKDPIGDDFRWFDEDDELDLSLAIEDPQVVPRSISSMSKRDAQPFRRGLSFSKMSFSRSSMTSFRPPTGESYTHTETGSQSPVHGTTHVRRKSRAFSLMGARHSTKASITSIDASAAHYQDPEARAKLRVYLASPQKFDEAVEFGFPSVDAAGQLPRRGSTRQSHRALPDEADKMKTFLSDDHSSTYSEDLSMPDSESPKTPQILEKESTHALQLPFDDFDEKQFKLSEGYMHAPAHAREMTLRMTLTRPDLRAQEDQMYGWQQAPRQQPAWRHSRAMTQSRYELSPLPDQNRELNKESIDKIFADIDQELDPTPVEGGAMRKLWKKVRRS